MSSPLTWGPGSTLRIWRQEARNATHGLLCLDKSTEYLLHRWKPMLASWLVKRWSRSTSSLVSDLPATLRLVKKSLIQSVQPWAYCTCSKYLPGHRDSTVTPTVCPREIASPGIQRFGVACIIQHDVDHSWASGEISGSSRFGKVPSVQPFQLSPNASTESQLSQTHTGTEFRRSRAIEILTLHLL